MLKKYGEKQSETTITIYENHDGSVHYTISMFKEILKFIGYDDNIIHHDIYCAKLLSINHKKICLRYGWFFSDYI
jgi:hypothetical protein